MRFIPSRRWFWAAAGLALLAPLGVAWPPALAVFLLCDAGWVLALLVDGWLAAGPSQVDVIREAPPAFSLGRSMPVWYSWSQVGRRRLRLRVREELPAPLVRIDEGVREIRIPPATVVRERVDIRPERRGPAVGGPIALRCLGPLGLIWRQGTLERPWTAVVFPSLAGIRQRGLPAQASRRREAGLRSIRRPGEGRLFESLKEWVPGDETRTIDWKATARRRKLMVRRYEDERRQQVLLVIDAGRLLTAEVDDVPRLEYAIRAALQLAHAAVEHDDNVGLMVFAQDIECYLPPARGRRALRGILNALAGVEGRLVESDYPAAFRYLATRNRKRAMPVVFTDIIDRAASEAFVTHIGSLRPRHLPLAVTLRDPALEAVASRRPKDAREGFERAAAEELLMARDAALGVMRSRGVLVLDVPPARASEAVIEQYTELKRRGVL